jgi:2-polyprenyl-3-methyl-5-hydroxy-6-metoxy-1,4-benzoquinol methylase
VRESLVDGHAVERLLLLVGALRSGLIDALAGQALISAEEAAALAGTNPRASLVVLEALAAEGIVEHVPIAGGADGEAMYRLTSVGRSHLVEEGPELERARLLHHVNKMRGWLQLDQVIRTGKAVPKDWTTFDLRAMVSAMGERQVEVLDEIVDRCFAYAGTIRTMVDIGGAVGHLSRRFRRRGVEATLFDREETLPIAREYLGEEGAAVKMVGGDLTSSLPAGRFDLVYFGNVLHIYSPETDARVTREAFSITTPGGTIAIQDYLWGMSRESAMFAVNMLRSTESGGVWTEQQHRGWLKEAGFVGIEVQTLETSGAQLVLGRRP